MDNLLVLQVFVDFFVLMVFLLTRLSVRLLKVGAMNVM